MKLDIFLLQETKIKDLDLGKFKVQWKEWEGKFRVVDGASGGLCTL